MERNENITLYSKIAQYLKEKIEKGEVQPNEKLPTEAELSEMFSVSRITTKRALQELEKQDLIIRRRGSGSYVKPRQEATAVRRDRVSPVVALLMPYEIANVRLLEILKGASNCLSKNGYLITVLNIDPDHKTERDVFDRSYREFSGIIYYPGYEVGNIDLLYNLYLQHYPLVTIDKYLYDIPFSYVSTDNFGGVQQSVSYLTGLGHRKIAFLVSSDLTRVSSVRQRFYGYCSTLHEKGIPIYADLVSGYTSQEELRALVQRWIADGVTAVQAENDDCAIQLMQVCRGLSISVPDQLSVIGYDNLISSRYSKPELTTIEQGFYAIGEQAAKVFLKISEEKDFSQAKCLIPSQLVVRASCTRPVSG